LLTGDTGLLIAIVGGTIAAAVMLVGIICFIHSICRRSPTRTPASHVADSGLAMGILIGYRGSYNNAYDIELPYKHHRRRLPS